MNLTPYFKSIIDQDVASVVICNLKHEIIYMNPKAVESYHKWGGEALLGKSLMNCHNPKSKEIIEKVVAWFEEDKEHNRIHTFYNEKQAKDVYMVALRDEDGTLIGAIMRSMSTGHGMRNRITISEAKNMLLSMI